MNRMGVMLAAATLSLGVGFDTRGRGSGRMPLPEGKGGRGHFTSEKPLSKRAKRRQRGRKS